MARFCAMLMRFVDRERPAHEAALLRRVDRLGAAAHAAQPALHMQRRDIAADRRFRRARHFDEFGDGRHGPRLDGGQNDAVAFGFVQGLSP